MDVAVKNNSPQPVPLTSEDIGAFVFKFFCGEGGVVDRIFMARGLPNPWRDIKPETKKDKRKKGYAPINDQTRTGKLHLDAKNPGMVEMGDGFIRLQITPSQNKYAAAHQYGRIMGKRAKLAGLLEWAMPGLRKSGRRYKNSLNMENKMGEPMPARPFWILSEADAGRCGEELAKFILESEGF